MISLNVLLPAFSVGTDIERKRDIIINIVIYSNKRNIKYNRQFSKSVCCLLTANYFLKTVPTYSLMAMVDYNNVKSI